MSLQLLAIHNESEASESISLPEGARTIRVGRVEGNDVQINHTSISAKHALLKISEANGVEIVDCNSSNGTFVNGIRIDRTALQVGDVVKFAYLSYKVVDSSGDTDPEPAPESTGAISDPSEALERQTDKGEEAIFDPDQEIRDQSEKEKSLESKIEEQRQRVEELEKERSVTLKKQEELEAKVREQEERINTLRDESRERFDLLSESESVKEQHEKDFRKLTEENGKVLRELSSRTRERDDLNASLEKARSEIQEKGAELLERDQVIAAGQFESDRLARELEKSEAKVTSLESECLQWGEAYEALKVSLEETTTALEESRGGESSQRERLDQFLGSFREYLVRLHQDWDYWKIEASLKGAENLESIEDCFSEAEGLRVAIRRELDAIEPIWEKYGKRVEAELESQIAALESRIADLDSRKDEKVSEVESLTEDVRGLREKVDVEVRRAQGLSRRGVQIEIPERFESMVIAQDRERQILLSLVGSLEFLEEVITGYRRSKKLREVVFELDEFAKRIIAILESNGVKEFTLEPGTELTLKHRKEVKILEKKGWGTREYGEQPFHPGTVKKVVRSGYRAGQGDGSVLLRKVEVLIRDAEG